MPSSVDSFLCGEWKKGKGEASTLYNPSTEEALSEASTAGLDLGAAVRFAREKGGPALRAMTFAARAELLRKLAKGVADLREELIGIGIANAGNTRGDAKFDIDGAAATLLYYADLGQKLGEQRVLADGEALPIGRSARLYGQHVLLPREGVAVHINAFNFPAWGMAEKLAVALLAGMPAITKPATATAMMTHRIVQKWVEEKVLPDGALQLLAGGAGDLLSHLRGQDVVAFTGSGHTAVLLRRNENLARHNVHLNVEADSLNAAILGPDVQDGSETMNLFLAEVVKEITQKAGQKCTAVRRIYVAKERVDAVRDAVVERLREARVGNPADEKVTMGPLATAAQLKDVREGIGRLASGAEVATGGAGAPEQVIGGATGKGYFVAPTLLVLRSIPAGHPVNEIEVFGPVSSMIPYGGAEELVGQVAAGGGGLVSAVYSDDKEFVQKAVLGIAAHHGRVCIGGEKVAGQTVPPGTVMPQLLHGGPGRAGGGEELGGARGMALYQQRTALQGPRAIIEQLVGAPAAK
ncbi:MAG TPA: 3,4-dehydroadipyl-CoA semialdehyde dehydrogenase [Myxococcaceae bacterium]|jgi:oxepin-CoA hydrolase/3-oxo-5,6-dehydrosuberyl-CoA semialdehyde dehydrogenase